MDNPTGRRGRFRYNKETDSFEQVNQAPKIQVHHVNTDEIPPTLSMTGSDKWFTSKSALRRHYKEEGFVEVGTVQPPAPPKDREQRRREIRETVEKSLNDIRYGMAPISEKERERVLREEREWNSYKKRMT
jgi:hypothetical protein